jgi:hypothetical protein
MAAFRSWYNENWKQWRSSVSDDELFSDKSESKYITNRGVVGEA